MPFTQTHLNLTQSGAWSRAERTAPGGPPIEYDVAAIPDGRDCSSALAAAILYLANLGGSPPRRGGTIYFPPGVYVIAPTYLRPPDAPPVRRGPIAGVAVASVPANITLMFAPGACLDIAPGYYVEIGGPIDAGLDEIFVSSTRSRPRGAVILTGDWVNFRRRAGGQYLDGALPRAYPEWWGAIGSVGDLGPSSTDAIQAAIDATFSFRAYSSFNPEPPTFNWRGEQLGPVVRYPPLELTFSARYLLDRPVLLGAPGDSSVGSTVRDGFLLRGAGGLTSDGTTGGSLVARHDFDGESLLLVEDPGGGQIIDMLLDAAFQANACVALRSSAAGAHTRVSGCVFRRSRRDLVVLGASVPAAARLAPVSPDPAASTLANNDGAGDARSNLPGVVFEHCWFARVPRRADAAPGVTIGRAASVGWNDSHAFTDAPENPRRQYGVTLRLADASTISFRYSRFSGSAAAMVCAYGGSVDVVACTFQNALRPLFYRHSSTFVIATGSGSALLPFTSLAPYDLDPPGAQPLHRVGFPNAVDVFVAPPLGSLASGATRATAARSTVSMTLCDSRSYALLAAAPGVRPGASQVQIHSSLVAVRHASFGEPVPAAFEPASVAWTEGDDLRLIGASLVRLDLSSGALALSALGGTDDVRLAPPGGGAPLPRFGAIRRGDFVSYSEGRRTIDADRPREESGG